MLDALFLQELVGLLLLPPHVGLYLVYLRLHLVVQEQVLQSLVGKTRHADGTDAPRAVEPFHGPPRAIVVAVGLVDEVEVEVVQPQLLHRAVEGPQRSLVAVVLHPEFRHHEQFFALDATLADGGTHGLLVHVRCSRVNVAIAHLQCVAHGLLAHLLVVNLEYAVAYHRHPYSVVQCCVLHNHCYLLLYESGCKGTANIWNN